MQTDKLVFCSLHVVIVLKKNTEFFSFLDHLQYAGVQYADHKQAIIYLFNKKFNIITNVGTQH